MGTVSAVTLLVWNGAAVSGGRAKLRARVGVYGGRELPQREVPGGGAGARSLSPGGGEVPPASLSQGWAWARVCTPPGPGVPEPHLLRFGPHGPHPLRPSPRFAPDCGKAYRCQVALQEPDV